MENNAFNAYEAARLRDQSWVPVSMVTQHLVEQIQRLVEEVAKRSGSDTLYTIPMQVSGFPMYNRQQITQYVIEYLQKRSFYVKHVHEYTIYISWRHITPSSRLGDEPVPRPPAVGAVKKTGPLNRRRTAAAFLKR
jgi:hypothetical protein